MNIKIIQPNLRFKEFSDNWEIKKFSDVATDFMYGLNAAATTYNGRDKYIRITDINDELNTYSPHPLTSPEGTLVDKFKLSVGDIVFARTGASTGKSYIYDENDGNLYFAGFLIKASIQKANPHFIFYQTLIESYRRWIKIMSIRTGQPGINAEEYKQLKMSCPSIKEQQKIASFLTSVDSKISQLTEKHRLLKEYKKGVMQQIFSQQLRFKDEDGKVFPEWEEIKFGDFLTLDLRKVTKPSGKFLALGVRSHVKGVFHKPNFDPKKIAMEELYVVKKDDLILSITFAWEGAIAIASNIDEGGLVSHRFPTFIFKLDKMTPDFFKHIISNLKLRYFLGNISPGGAGRNRVLNKNDFLKIKWDIPCLDEQQKISQFLQSIDKKIDAVAQQVEQTKQFKKGLLQQMFV